MKKSKEVPQLEREQRERLTEIGSYLRNVREEHALSLEDVAAKTWIRANLLRAIEEGQLSQLPEAVYVRGLIKRYADAVGIDGDACADAFPIQAGARSFHVSWQNSPAAQLRPLHLYVAYIVLIMSAISGLSHALRESNPLEATATRPPSPALQAPASASPTPDSTVAPSAALPTAQQDKPVRVDVTLTAQSWLKVVVDGRTEFEGVLTEGTQRTWTANDEVTLRAGNAGGVMVAYNNGQAQQMGEPGSVEEVTFSVGQNAASTLSFPVSTASAASLPPD